MKKLDLTNLKHEIEKKEIKSSILIQPEEKPLVNLEDLENLEMLNITTDSTLNEALKIKALEYANVSYKTTIWLGKHFSEVFDLLSSENANQHTSYFSKYLKFVGANERTVRRYRKRYKLFSMFDNENTKKLILKLTDEEINLVFENKDLLEKLENEEITKEKFKILKSQLLIEDKSQESSSIFQMPELNINTVTNKLENLYEKISKDEKLDQKTLTNIQKHLDKIEKILNNFNSSSEDLNENS